MSRILYSLVIILFISYVHSGWTPLHAALYSDIIHCDHNKNLELDVSEVQVFFHDFSNNFSISFPINDAVDGITNNYNLDVSKRLVFFVPGYASEISGYSDEIIREAFIDIPNIYLIVIDHFAYTNFKGGRVKSYERSVKYTYYIGTALGEFLTGIHRNGFFPSKNIHAIGFSLGSQMLGHTGTKYMENTSEKLWRITAIDPAGPCFSNSLIDEQIRSGVAEYVEVYHCNAGGLGTTSVLADTDFFINHKGKLQPHCDSHIPLSGESHADKCSHRACLRYWAKTVHEPGWYLAWACDSYEDFKHGRCAGNQVTIAGYSNPGNATGVFYASTETYGVI